MKIKEFQSVLKNNKVDLVLLHNINSSNYDCSIFYFSGYKGIGALIIPKSKKPFLITPKMEIERAKKSFKKVYLWGKKKLFASINHILKKNKIKFKTIGIDFSKTSINIFKALKKEFRRKKIKDISKELLDLRKIKTKDEIKKLKRACSIADKILQKCLKNFKKFKTESEIASFLEYEAKKNACEVSFPSIVASGKNASMPHYEPKNIKLRKGFCVIDFGVKYKGYCSDITRTVYIGKPYEKEKEIYSLLLNTQKNIIKKIKVNDKCGKIYNYCLRQLKNYSKYLTHGLGHGVGVEIHELPNLTLNSKEKIEENMIFTIEPGIYMQNKFGIRIEDTVLMGKYAKPLTKTTKELLVFIKQ